MGLEDLPLFQKRIDQSGLAMVHVGYDGQVTDRVVLIVAQINSPQYAMIAMERITGI